MFLEVGASRGGRGGRAWNRVAIALVFTLLFCFVFLEEILELRMVTRERIFRSVKRSTAGRKAKATVVDGGSEEATVAGSEASETSIADVAVDAAMLVGAEESVDVGTTAPERRHSPAPSPPPLPPHPLEALGAHLRSTHAVDIEGDEREGRGAIVATADDPALVMSGAGAEPEESESEGKAVDAPDASGPRDAVDGSSEASDEAQGTQAREARAVDPSPAPLGRVEVEYDPLRGARVPAWTKHAAPPHAPPQKGGRPCEAGCEDRGVCNRWTGECHCPFDFTGKACDVPVLPACQVRGAPFDPFPWLGTWINQDNAVVDVEIPLAAAGVGGEGAAAEGKAGMRTVRNVMVHGGGVPCECLRQAQGLELLLTRMVEADAIYNLKLGAILCMSDLAEGVTWDDLVEKGAGPGASDPRLSKATFRLMPPDLMTPENRDINGADDYLRDSAQQITEPEGFAVSDPVVLAKMLLAPVLSWTRDIEPESATEGDRLPEFNPTASAIVRVAPAAACNGGGGCGRGGWCAGVDDPAGSFDGLTVCMCYPGATQSFPGGDCAWVAPEDNKALPTSCAPGCDRDGACDGKGFCKCKKGRWGIDCSITMGADGFPTIRRRGLGAAEIAEIDPSGGDAFAKSPRVYVMDLPPLLYRGNSAVLSAIPESLDIFFLEGPHRVADPYLADYFYIPGHVMAGEHHRSKAKLRWARERQPYWNATVAAARAVRSSKSARSTAAETGDSGALMQAPRIDALMDMDASDGAGDGAARHLIGWYSERGAGDSLGTHSLDLLSLGCYSDKKEQFEADGHVCAPDDLRITSPARVWGQITVNGNSGEFRLEAPHSTDYHHPCLACFVPGVDVTLPLPMDGSECPSCSQITGVWQTASEGERAEGGAKDVEAYVSVAGDTPYAPNVVDALAGQRRFLGFFQGRAGLELSRGGSERNALWSIFGCNHSEIRFINTENPECLEQAALISEGHVNEGTGFVDSSVAFTSAKFCFVPLGATGGDARRHMASVAYGCVPVIVHDGIHMPFDELVDWSSVAVFVKDPDFEALNETLTKIVMSGEYKAKQRRLAAVWPWLYWISGDPEAWRTNDGFGTPPLFDEQCDRGLLDLKEDFKVRWPKQTAVGVKMAREAAANGARWPRPSGDPTTWPGPKEWGDGGATSLTGALGGLMAVLHNRLVQAGELPDSRRLPRQ